MLSINVLSYIPCLLGCTTTSIRACFVHDITHKLALSSEKLPEEAGEEQVLTVGLLVMMCGNFGGADGLIHGSSPISLSAPTGTTVHNNGI